MPTPFGQAMITSMNGHPQNFNMRMTNGPNLNLNCSSFLNTRPEENNLLNGLMLPDKAAVLDLGCGVGRHLHQLRQTFPSIHCYGTEICQLMLDYCTNNILGQATFSHNLEDFTKLKFDLILLVGNGLGLLGSEEQALIQLSQLVKLLKKDGRIVIETGNPFGHGYCAPEFTIGYGGYQDEPFIWGHSDRAWITNSLQQLNLEVTIHPSAASGNIYFFAVGKRL